MEDSEKRRLTEVLRAAMAEALREIAEPPIGEMEADEEAMFYAMAAMVDRLPTLGDRMSLTLNLVKVVAEEYADENTPEGRESWEVYRGIMDRAAALLRQAGLDYWRDKCTCENCVANREAAAAEKAESTN